MKTGKIIPLTGTFIDGIACDIPANNWSFDIWREELKDEKALGIDTLIIIRVGFGDSSMYKSSAMNSILYNEEDLLEFILSEADKLEMKVFIGLYDTGKYWRLNDWETEVFINYRVIDEIIERYIHHSSFYGWYLSHEGDIKFHQELIWKPLAEKLRYDTPEKKILISPRYAGKKYEPDFAVTPEIHAKHFHFLCSEMQGLIDYAAFMDGHVDFHELPDFMAVTAEVMKHYGIAYWSNLETFDRDMPWRFPPIEWNKMRYKLEIAQKYVEKIVSFEVPHFLSRHSCFPAAARLRKRYIEYLQKQKKLLKIEDGYHEKTEKYLVSD